MLNKINVLIEEEKIQARIKEIAKQIEKDYEGEEITLICILKGAVYFAIDLSKEITKNTITLDFMKVSSYGNSLASTGNIELITDTSTDIHNKNVIIVEDILDSGNTLNYLSNYLKAKQPKSLKICVLLDKKERREVSVKADYIGFEIENKFVVGYGLDYEDKYRNLPYVGWVK